MKACCAVWKLALSREEETRSFTLNRCAPFVIINGGRGRAASCRSMPIKASFSLCETGHEEKGNDHASPRVRTVRNANLP